VGKILIAPDPKKPFRVETDVSKWALSGVLYQEKDGQWRPIAFHSRKLAAAELNYDAGDQELLAIIDSVKHWRHHLLGANHPVHIIMDHKNLVKFTMTKELT
jgi:RNase H-like domain found in reverse transcriptase